MSAEQPYKQDAPNLRDDEAEDAKDAAVLQALTSEPYAVSDGELNQLAGISGEDENLQQEPGKEVGEPSNEDSQKNKETPGGSSTGAKKPSLGKTFGIVAILTVLSKCAGLIRDIVVLQAFGTNYLSDAFNNATLFTGNILILFGGWADRFIPLQ